MGADEVTVAIGIGCRSACPAGAIVALVRQTLAELPDRPLARGLFTLAEKRGEPGITEAAALLGLPVTFLDRESIQAAAGGVVTRSARVAALYGVPSVAEAAALAGAGPGGVLVVPRRSATVATCAIARVP